MFDAQRSTTPSIEGHGQVLVLLKARFLQIMLVSAAIIGWVVVGIQAAGDGEIALTAAFAVVLTGVMLGGITFLLRGQFVDQAAYLAVIAFTLISLVASIGTTGVAAAAFTLIAAAFLTGRYPYRIIVTLLLLKHLQPVTDLRMPENVSEVIEVFTIVSIMLMLAVTVRFLSDALQNLVSVSERTNHLLQGVSEIGQVMSRLVQLDELFPRAVDLIRERFAFYHVQIFQVDDAREYAVLVASTGEAGKQLLARGHRLAVGSQSVIGRVSQIGEVVIALDSDRDTVHARNELLRDTRSELAVPIIEGDRIIGALDVQSTRPNAFDVVDIQALQAMANQLASAIRTARLFEEQQESVQENKRVLLEAEMSLREIQRLNQQLTRADWERYLDEDGRVMGVTLGAEGLETDAKWTDDMIAASRTRQPVLRKDDQRVISVPIVLRGEVLGAIEITPEDDVREADASEMIQSVAERLAISLDNARLFEEAQAATRQEQRINEIVGRYQSAATVEELLQITLTELSESLGAQQAAIRLSATPPGTNGTGPHANGYRHDDAASGGNET